MDYKEAIKYIKSGEAVLFVGSRFSDKAKNKQQKTVPNTEELKQHMERDLDDLDSTNNDDYSFKDLAEYYSEKKGTRQFVKLLENQFTISETTDTQKTIAKQPWLAIFTTNYDDVIETITQKKSISPSSDKAYEVDLENYVIHVNGAISNINSQNVNSELLLTNSSYIENRFLDSPLQTLFLESLDRAKAIFFVGFSFKADLDLQRIFYNSGSKEKTFFVTGESSVIEENRLSKFGNVTSYVSDKFAEDIKQLPSQEVIRPTLEQISAFDKIEPKVDLVSDKASSVDRLLKKGDVDFQYVLDPGYVVQRWEDLVPKFKKSQPKFRVFIIKSKLGNGKTIFMNGLAKYLATTNNVYMYKPQFAEFFVRDLSIIKKNVDNAIIFIDDFYKVQHLFSHFKTIEPDVKLVISGRTSIIGQSINMLKQVGDFKSEEICYLTDLDTLNDKEFKEWKQIIDKNNLWGIKKIKKSKTFSDLLVKYFESQGILNKYESLIIENNKKESALVEKRLIIALLISNLLRFDINFQDLFNVTKTTLSDEITNSQLLREFIDFSTGKIILRGVVLSRSLLHKNNLFTEEEITDVLKRLMNGFDRNNQMKSRFVSNKRELVSFSNLKLIFGRNRNIGSVNSWIDSYYTNIMNLRFTKHNPFFWVQIAISKIDEEKWDLAETYVNNAYREAKGRSLTDEYQIATTETDLFVQSSFYYIKEDIEKFIDNFKSAVQNIKKIHNAAVVASLFAKLNNTSLIDKLDELNEERKREVVEGLFEVIKFLKLSPDNDDIMHRRSDLPKNIQKIISLYNRLKNN